MPPMRPSLIDPAKPQQKWILNERRSAGRRDGGHRAAARCMGHFPADPPAGEGAAGWGVRQQAGRIPADLPGAVPHPPGLQPGPGGPGPGRVRGGRCARHHARRLPQRPAEPEDRDADQHGRLGGADRLHRLRPELLAAVAGGAGRQHGRLVLPAGRAGHDHRAHPVRFAGDGDRDVPAVHEPRHQRRAADRGGAGLGLLQPALLGGRTGRPDLRPDRDELPTQESQGRRGRRGGQARRGRGRGNQPPNLHQYLGWYRGVILLNSVVVVSCEVLATKYVQNWPLRLTALAGFGLVAVGYGIYGIGIVPVFLILGTLFWTGSEIIGAPTTFAYPGMVAPPNLRGRYFGAMQSTFGLGTAIGPVIGITLWNHLGQGVWLCAAASGVIATICARIGMRIPSAASEVSPEPAVSEPASGNPRPPGGGRWPGGAGGAHSST